MDEQMFCFQCEQAAHCTACTGKAGVCGKSADTAAAQDRLTGALISYASQLIGEGRAPAPEQALLPEPAQPAWQPETRLEQMAAELMGWFDAMMPQE